MPIIATRSDLDSLTGTEEYARFMKFLEGSIWKLRLDLDNKVWTVVEDTRTIEKFLFTKNDFPNAQPPAIPPYIEQTPVPQEVTRAQARKALVIAGLFDLVEPAIANILDPIQRQLALIDWNDAQYFSRNNATLLSIANTLNLTDQDLDNLFIQASKL